MGRHMDIFFTDPSDIPLPPDEVRIRQLKAEPWPDGRRLRVYLELSPFQKKPDGEISVVSNTGIEVANVSIIETMDPKMEFTLHLRGEEPQGLYRVNAVIFYRGEVEDDQKEAETPPLQPSKVIVDHLETTFEI